MLQGIDLACVRGERTIFSRVNFTVAPGEMLLVQGVNGSGKTSLLRMVCGLLLPELGEIRWRGESIRSSRERYHAEMAYFGHAPAIKDDLTAVENLRFACQFEGQSLDREAASKLLGELGLVHGHDLPARALSQGQRRRIAIARLSLSRARLWILDEPLTALDQAALGTVQSLLGRHLGAGGMAIVTTHQPITVDGVQPKVLRLSA